MAAPITGSARVTTDGKVTQLDGRANPAEVVTEADVQEPAKLARLLGRLLADVAALKRRFAPRRLDFEDIVVGSSGSVSFAHNFGGRARWWIVGWKPTGLISGTGAPSLAEDATNTTVNTLVLTSTVAGIVTVRVEAAG